MMYDGRTDEVISDASKEICCLELSERWCGKGACTEAQEGSVEVIIALE